MSRPAVIVGLGGTGQWVLTILKKDLLEQHNMLDRPDDPIPNVRLVALDTLTKPDAKAQSEVKLYEGEKRIGNIQLKERVEYIALGGQCKAAAEKIQNSDSDYKHLGFFQTKFYKDDLKFQEADWLLENGAGKFRQFGALAIYKELIEEGEKSRVYRTLERVINEVMPNDNLTKIEIIVISSLVGGTGSGMIIPIGILLNKMVEQIAKGRGNFRAVVVLPGAFTQGTPNQEMNVRALAALRELWRQQIPPAQPREVTLVPTMEKYQKAAYKSPYTGIYMVDGLRNNVAIGKVTEGVFPAIALWIQQVIDDEAGQFYRGYVDTNRKGEGVLNGQRNAEGVFGVLGAYSLFSPNVMLRKTHSLKLVHKVVEHLAADYKGDDQVGRDEISPSRAARAWMSENASFRTTVQNSTMLKREMVRILNNGHKDNQDEIDLKVSDGVHRPSPKDPKQQGAIGWFSLITSPELSNNEDPSYKSALSEFDATFIKKFSYPPDTVQNAHSKAHIQRLTHPQFGVEPFIGEHHGQRGQDGNWGLFGDAVKTCMEKHEGVFQKILELRLLKTLSAKDAAQKGSIDYAIRILDQMELDHKALKVFLDQVKAERQQKTVTDKAYTAMVNAREFWIKTPSRVKEGLIDKVLEIINHKSKLNSAMLESERKYLEACSTYTACLREDAVAFFLADLLDRELEFLRKTREGLKTWRFSLSVGNPAKNIFPLRKYAKEELQRGQDMIDMAKRLKEVEELVQMSVDDQGNILDLKDYQPSKEDLENALAGLKWDLDPDAQETGLKFKLQVHPLNATQGVDIELLDDKKSLSVIDKAQQANLDHLIRTLGQSYVDRPGIVPWLGANKTAGELTNDLIQNTLPLASYGRHTSHGQYFIVSANWGAGNSSYQNQVEDQLKTAHNLRPNEYQVTNFENPYRLTAISTYTGLILQDFDVWKSCTDSFNEYIKSEMGKHKDGEGKRSKNLPELIRTMQSFYTQKEEQAAISREITRVFNGYKYRMTDPRAVQLLGTPQELERALKCFALGWIENEPAPNNPGYFHWKLNIPNQPKDMETWLTPNQDQTPAQPIDEFDALHGMVVVGTNHCSMFGREGTLIDIKAIDNQLKKAEEIQVGQTVSELKRCLKKALEQGEFVHRWHEKAGQKISPSGGESFDDQAYWDIADYAQDLFEGMIK